MENYEKYLDCFRGCLAGGASGDALGYAVEFQRYKDIVAFYGSDGITEYALGRGGALISDDTQMTLYTACGLLSAVTNGLSVTVRDYADRIGLCYRDWAKTQSPRDDRAFPAPVNHSWLTNVPQLRQRRAPGNTCLSSLYSVKLGSTAMRYNDSCGCGGVMRVAPIGLFGPAAGWSQDDTDMLGAEAAALTHGHELGWISAAMLANIVSLCAYRPELSLREVVNDAVNAAKRLFAGCEHLDEQLELIEIAEAYSKNRCGDVDNIHSLGGGWTGHEALAIAVYCALRYENDFERMLIASVNHSGDSDSTGAIAGNILGARVGYEAIPDKFKKKLELRDVILDVADDLCRGAAAGCEDDIWRAKYIDCTYAPADC